MQKYLKDREVAARFGVERGSIWRWVRLGHFPQPVKLSAGCTRWPENIVEKWETERLRRKEA